MARTRVVMYAPGMVRLSRVVDERLVHPVTDAVAEDMRRYVPVLTGDLLSTIEAEHGDGYGRVTFGDLSRGIDYHLYQEFGTSKMQAQPYARPALYKTRSL
jgi:hypothetical protein